MSNTSDAMTRFDRLLAITGCGLVVVGTMLPWITVNPRHDGPVPAIYLPGMGSGAEAVGIVIIPAVIGLAVVLALRASRRTAGLSIAGGLFVFLVVGLHVMSYAGFHWTFVPGIGVPVTLLGGGMLVMIGAKTLQTTN